MAIINEIRDLLLLLLRNPCCVMNSRKLDMGPITYIDTIHIYIVILLHSEFSWNLVIAVVSYFTCIPVMFSLNLIYINFSLPY